MFGTNDHLYAVRSAAPELFKPGERIRELRSEIGVADAFQPYERFLHYRNLCASRGSNIPEEPKLSAALLAELEGEAPGN